MAHNPFKSIMQGLAIVLAVGFLLGISGNGGVAQTMEDQQAANETRIELGCQNPGSLQETGKTPVITNTAEQALTKDQRIAWSASDGDSGEITLEEELPKGAKMFGRGSPGGSYSCQAYAQG